MNSPFRALIAATAVAVTVALQAPAYADPPVWTPAGADQAQGDRQDERHGHEGGHDHGHHYAYGHYHGYHGDDWDDDYGVVHAGRCDTDAVLGAMGAVTGAIIGNRSATPENRGIATVFGAIAGGIIGAAVGDAIDDGDRACMGQSLELGRIGQPVVWVNPHTDVSWQLLPLRDVSSECREFELRRTYGEHHGREQVVACRRGRGDWAVRQP